MTVSTTSKAPQEATSDTSQMALFQVPVEMLPVAKLVLHPLADRVPRMREAEREAFLADVKARGVQEPIIVQKGNVILDGRNRWEAAQKRGNEMIPAKVVDISEKDQLDILFGQALHRRNQTDDQRAIVAAFWYENASKLSKHERASKAGKASSQGKRGKRNSAHNASAKLPEAQPQDQSTTNGESAKPASAKQRTERSDEKAAKQYGVPLRKLKTALALVKSARRLALKVVAGTQTLTGAKKEQRAKKQNADAPEIEVKKKPKRKKHPAAKEGPAADEVGSSVAQDDAKLAVVEDGDFRMTLSRPFDLTKLANALYDRLGHEAVQNLGVLLTDESLDAIRNAG